MEETVKYTKAYYYHIVNRDEEGNYTQSFPGFKTEINGGASMIDYPQKYFSYLDAVHDLAKLRKSTHWKNAVIIRPLVPCYEIETTEQDFKDDEDSWVETNESR